MKTTIELKIPETAFIDNNYHSIMLPYKNQKDIFIKK